MNLHLLTRPKGENAEIRINLEESGQDCVEEHLLAIKKFPPGIAKLQDFLLSKKASAVIITSKNALFGLKFIADKNIPIFVISQNIAKTLQKSGFNNAIPARGDAKSMHEMLKNYQLKGPIIYLRGENISTSFKDDARIIEQVIYRAVARSKFTQATANLFQQNKIKHVWLHSARSAESFLCCFKKLNSDDLAKNLGIICQSQAIAEKLPHNFFAAINYPKTATVQAMLELKGKLELIATPQK